MSNPPFVLLPSFHARAQDQFQGAAELERSLRKNMRGEIRFYAASKALYATDASNYRHIPIGVVIPRNEEDVVTAVAICRVFGAPILSRGAGTSLAGQGCNFAVILDFSKFMNRMSAVDPVARTVHVQPGIVLDRVRDAAEKINLTFAPDPATHSRCTIGGMTGNNSCGVHALMGGKTADNIHSLDLLLDDGTRMIVGPTSASELSQHIAVVGRVGGIYAALKRLGADYADHVRTRFPKIPRRVSGYNLDELLPESDFNVARALAGSESTCVIVLGATFQLVESPKVRTLMGIGSDDIFLAADHVPSILEHHPIGLEGMDNLLLDALRRKQKSVEDLGLLPPGRGFLLVEFGGATQAESEQQAQALAAALAAVPTVLSARIYTSAESARVWHIRESGLAVTTLVPGQGTGWEGWEDAAVDPAQLGSYLRAIYALMKEFHYNSPLYGHFGQGCVHMRHNFDLESEAGILSFHRFMNRAVDITLDHGGSLSGEHGDGQVRSALLPRMFGPELIEAFRSFKRIWDPGKLIDAHQPHEDLRLGADYKPQAPKTHFAFLEDNGSFASANLRCVCVGACRKQDAGTLGGAIKSLLHFHGRRSFPASQNLSPLSVIPLPSPQPATFLSGLTPSTITSTRRPCGLLKRFSQRQATDCFSPRNTSVVAAPFTTSACSTRQRNTCSRFWTHSPHNSQTTFPSSSSSQAAPPSSGTSSPTCCRMTHAPSSSATEHFSSASSWSNTLPAIAPHIWKPG